MNHHIPNHYYGHLALASQLANSGSKGHNQHGQQTSTTSINVVEGKQLVLECNAFGLPKPTINWHVKRFKSENVTGKYLKLFLLIKWVRSEVEIENFIS